MSIDNIIAQAVARAVNALYGVETDPSSIVPQTTKKEFEGNLTVVVFPWVKAARKAPEAVGKEIGDWLVDNEPAVNRYNVIKGFLNIVIEPTYFMSMLRHISETPDYGTVPVTPESPLVMVEYSSPNTNKPLQPVADTQGMRQPRGKDQYRQRPRHTHMQVYACLAQVGRGSYSRVDRQKGRPSHR